MGNGVQATTASKKIIVLGDITLDSLEFFKDGTSLEHIADERSQPLLGGAFFVSNMIASVMPKFDAVCYQSLVSKKNSDPTEYYVDEEMLAALEVEYKASATEAKSFGKKITETKKLLRASNEDPLKLNNELKGLKKEYTDLRKKLENLKKHVNGIPLLSWKVKKYKETKEYLSRIRFINTIETISPSKLSIDKSYKEPDKDLIKSIPEEDIEMVVVQDLGFYKKQGSEQDKLRGQVCC